MKRFLFISTLASVSLLLTNNALADREHHRYYHKDEIKHHEGHYYHEGRNGKEYKHDKHSHKHHYHHKTVVIYERDYYAPVTEVRPIYRKVAVSVPRDSCHVETVAYRERHGRDSLQGVVMGGVIGAAIGKEIGNSGHATAAGGLIGAAIGNEIGGGGRTVTHYEDREVCTTQYRTRYERQLVGYEVSYLYGGRIYHTETRHHPGNRIRHR